MELFFILLGSIVVGLFRSIIQSPRKRIEGIEERIEEMKKGEADLHAGMEGGYHE